MNTVLVEMMGRSLPRVTLLRQDTGKKEPGPRVA